MVTRPASERLRVAVVALVLIALVALCGVVLGRIYAGTLLPTLVAGAGAGAVLLGVLTRRLAGWIAGPLSVLALSGYALLAIWLSARAANVPGRLTDLAVDASVNAIPRLLTALIPIEPQPDTVLVPVVAAWLAGFIGAELAIRLGHVLLGFAGPTLCYAAALYLVGPNAGTAVWQTLGYAALVAVGLAAYRQPHSAPMPHLDRSATAQLSARLACGAAALTVLALLGAAIGPAVAARVPRTPDDPRRLVVPPALDALDENPLIRLSGWAVNPDQHLLDATVDRDCRLRLAVLTDYDGVTWRIRASYRGAGRALPAAAELAAATAAATEPITQQITIAELDGHLLPAAGIARHVDGVRVAIDTATGTLVRPEGLTPGLRYTVTSERPRPEVNLVPSADVPTGPEVARFLRLDAAPPEEFERLARHIVEGSAGPYQRAAAIEQFLAGHYRLVSDAPSGHAYPNLNFFLFGARNAGGQRGTAEQFAAAFAVLGRIVGLPTRVVVGFQVRAGTTRVTGADALAWPEVLFTGLGWVPFYPLPEADSTPIAVEEDFRPNPQPSTPPPSQVPTVTVSVPAQQSQAAAPPRTRTPSALPAVAVTTGGVLLTAAVAFIVAVPVLRRAQRRRRLDRGSAAHRVTGAWLEVRDALRLAGRPAASHLTASELADHARRAAGFPRGAHRARRVRLPAPPLDDLVAVVNAATFGPYPPGETEAHRARTQALAYAAELRARRPWLRRLLWTIHPGPLRWHTRHAARRSRRR